MATSRPQSQRKKRIDPTLAADEDPNRTHPTPRINTTRAEAEVVARALLGGEPGTPEWRSWPLDEQAWVLSMRGMSLRAIARELRIDKDTANRYVRLVEREVAPRRKADRDRYLRRAVASFEQVKAAAWTQYDGQPEAMLLTVVRGCERDIAQLHGLFAAAATLDDGSGGGITITITKRGEVTVTTPPQGEDASTDSSSEEE